MNAPNENIWLCLTTIAINKWKVGRRALFSLEASELLLKSFPQSPVCMQ